MAYREALKKEILKAPKTVGNQLGRWAVYLDFSVARISKVTGATRQTIYNWITGGQVTQAYREKVEDLLRTLRGSKTGEQAWREVCQRYNIKN
jgi:hypothetical protein